MIWRYHIHQVVLRLCLIPGRIGIWKSWVLRRRENRSTRRKTSRCKGENQQQNSTHIWRRRQDLKPSHTGGRRALSPLRHPLLPWRQKSRAWRFFYTFLCPRCTITTWNFLISRFVEEVNTRQRFCNSFFKPRYSPLEYNSRKKSPTFDKLTNWTRCDMEKEGWVLKQRGFILFSLCPIMALAETHSHTTLNSDMRTGHIKENNTTKYVTRPRPKMSRPEMLILHI